MKPSETAPVSSIPVRPYRPHDMLWTDGFDALIPDDPLPSWVNEQWNASLPLIVRRDHSARGLIPVGIRAKEKHQRAPAWIAPENVSKAALAGNPHHGQGKTVFFPLCRCKTRPRHFRTTGTGTAIRMGIRPAVARMHWQADEPSCMPKAISIC